jgi:hypothetical protein
VFVYLPAVVPAYDNVEARRGGVLAVRRVTAWQ